MVVTSIYGGVSFDASMVLGTESDQIVAHVEVGNARAARPCVSNLGSIPEQLPNGDGLPSVIYGSATKRESDKSDNSTQVSVPVDEFMATGEMDASTVDRPYVSCPEPRALTSVLVQDDEHSLQKRPKEGAGLEDLQDQGLDGRGNTCIDGYPLVQSGRGKRDENKTKEFERDKNTIKITVKSHSVKHKLLSDVSRSPGCLLMSASRSVMLPICCRMVELPLPCSASFPHATGMGLHIA